MSPRYHQDHYGAITVGVYNCLPPDTDVGYKPLPSVVLRRLPVVQTASNPRRFPPRLVRPAWDNQVTRSEIEAEMPLPEAYRRLARHTAGHWGGRDFDPADVSVIHTDWSRYPVGTRCTQRLVLGNAYGRAGPTIALAALCDLMRASRPAAFVGTLVSVAPYVCGTAPVSGGPEGVSKEYTDTVTITVASTTADGREFGLTATAGITTPGEKLDRTATMQWSISTSQTTEVAKAHSETTRLQVPPDHWGKIDIRACAGLYSGWLAYATGHNDDAIGLYPARVPIQAYGFPNPVAEHTMTAPATPI
ncbi:hypothetical protein AB0I81_36000 [Nonomuraea sp. NPDC050404]|uniref:hypothetical protein n=1 Tax=Nonomuraea sp. NPDC050404 TaxID=3155783 RepID=UPI00340762B9